MGGERQEMGNGRGEHRKALLHTSAEKKLSFSGFLL